MNKQLENKLKSKIRSLILEVENEESKDIDLITEKINWLRMDLIQNYLNMK